MINNLVPMKKKNIFLKVKDFFCRLFKKQKNKIYCLTENISYEKPSANSDSVFLEGIKVNVSDELQKTESKEEFIKELENDMTLLEHLSIERLERLNKYYDKLIEQDHIELKKLNPNYNN